jgi:isopentenyl phosphate kinase
VAELVFLKLGGSLITDKTRPYTARLDKLADLSGQIAQARTRTPGLRLILGHGSGSFGHTAAKEHGTREGIEDFTPAGSASGAQNEGSGGGGSYWQGFAEVHYQAAQLNGLVMDALHRAGIAALSFPPLASVLARDGQVSAWDLSPVRAALTQGLLPVIFGDTVFDQARGGTILSTEDLFQYLARDLRPDRILLAGLEAGVWEDFPARTRLLEEIDSGSYDLLGSTLGDAAGADVTGGMRSKVSQMLGLARELDLSAHIFSGETSGNLLRALEKEKIGTAIAA